MHRTTILPLAAVSALLFAPAARAADPAPGLTWAECVAQALRNNPDLSGARHSRESSRQSYRGSFNGILPQASLSNTYSESDGGGGPDWSASASIGMDIFNMARYADIRSSKASLSRAEANLWQASATLRLNLRRAYAQLLFAQENVEVSRNIKKRREQSARMVSLRYESGRESKGNMLRAQAQLMQAQAGQAQAERELRTAQRALIRHLGQPRFSVVVASGTLESRAADALPEHEAALLGSRPDVAAQEAAVISAEAALSRSKSALWPSLSARYSRSVSGPTEFPSRDYGWSFSGVLSYPLFGGGPTAAYHDITGSSKALEVSREALRSARDQALVEIESAWADFAGALDQSKVQSALLEAARQRNDEADVRYASGLLTYDNWEIIASDRVNQERQAIQARLSAFVAEAAYDHSLGKPLEE